MRPPLPGPHAEFDHLSKLDLRRLAEELLGNDPVVVDYCIAFVCAETRGLWHGRARAKMCRHLKHAALSRSQRDRLLACILARLEQGNFSEQFKDQLRLAIHVAPKATLASCRRSQGSTQPHVERYCSWALALPVFANAA